MNKLDIRNLHLADFGHNLNKTRQTLSDVILQEGDGPTVIPTLAKKITSELAEVKLCPKTLQEACNRDWSSSSLFVSGTSPDL